MILNGNQRGNAKEMALHLLKEENERVVIFEIRGFVADNLVEALQESYAISRATHCKQHMYSLSLNPPKSATPTDIDFQSAIDRVEKRLGLDNQPRVIVFHEKRGLDGELRRHAHAVWCRIDIDEMKAVQLSFDRKKLREISRELFVAHNWRMPDGLKDSKNRDPRNFTLAEWQQAKRAGKNAKELKALFQDCWALSDSKTAFQNALLEQGFVLAQGKRGHVAVDYQGEVYPISRWTGLKAKGVRERLGLPDGLPNVNQAQAVAAKLISTRLDELRQEQKLKASNQSQAIKHKLDRMLSTQQSKRQQQTDQQAVRWNNEQDRRNARLRRGLRGLLDRITGKRRRISAENLAETEQANIRDQSEQNTLHQHQESARKSAHSETSTQDAKHAAIDAQLKKDIQWLANPPMPGDEAEKNKERKQRRQRNRDGPVLS